LPKFHCYIGEPTSCYMDAIFDTYGLEELGYLEHSFLANPQVPGANLVSLSWQFPLGDYSQSVEGLWDVVEELQQEGGTPLLEIIFTEPMASSKYHYYLATVPSKREINANWSKAIVLVDENVKYNEELLFAPWYTYWQSELYKHNYTCLLTGELRLTHATKFLKTLAPKNALYVVSTSPGKPVPKKLYTIKDTWEYWVVWAYDFLWPGHRILEDHTAMIHLQMVGCSEAQHVVINARGPTWLTEGVCAMRHTANKSDCIYLVDNK